MASPEVSLLALGLVVILMFLCHACGTSLRKLIAYRRIDEPLIEPEIQSHRRQAWVPFALTAAALCLTLSFLLIARGKIEQVTSKQLDAATKQDEKSLQKLTEDTASGNLEAVVADNADVEAWKRQREAAQNTYNYAAGIAAMNLDLGILNIVLVAAAVIASYLHDRGTVTKSAAEFFESPRLTAKLDTLRQDALALRSRIHILNARVQQGISQAKYLALSAPLREWSAKASRLNQVVPLFRTENAKTRGIDVQLINGFKKIRSLEIVEPSQEPFILPQDLVEFEQRFSLLRSDIERLQAQSIIGTRRELQV